MAKETNAATTPAQTDDRDLMVALLNLIILHEITFGRSRRAPATRIVPQRLAVRRKLIYSGNLTLGRFK
jgi:hypothetical protein